MPPTLVTGVFGMNIKGLPFAELETTAILSVKILMAMASLAAYFIMKRLGVIR